MPLVLQPVVLETQSKIAKYHREVAQIVLLEELQQFPLIFKGGTALRLLYGGNRFSEDLDFDVENDLTDEGRKDLAESIRVHLSNQKGNWIKDKKLYGDQESFNYYFRAAYTVKGFGRHSVKIEISRKKSPNMISKLPIQSKLYPCDTRVKTYDLDTLMTGKLNALFTRHLSPVIGGGRIIQGRDVYDFIHFGKNKKIEWSQLDDYDSQDSEWIKNRFIELSRLVTEHQEAILKDINDLLLPNEAFSIQELSIFFDHLKTLNFPDKMREEIVSIFENTL